MSFKDFADKTYRKFENTLTIHVTNAPAELNWADSPRSLLLSIAKNKYLLKKITRRSLGHVTVEINYTDETGSHVHRFGGQGVKDLSQFARKLTKEGFGFSVILMPEHLKKHKQLSQKPLVTIDGEFEDSEELIEELDFNIYKENLNAFVTYKIKPETCRKLITYFDEYKEHSAFAEKDSNHHTPAASRYGFGADPLKFEGAGCATFIEAFYILAGLGDHYKNFYRSIYAPKKLFGHPAQGRKVGLGKLLFSNLKLSEKKDDSLFIEFPSPNEMYNQLKSVYETAEKYDGLQVLEKGAFGDSKSFYLVFDTNC